MVVSSAWTAKNSRRSKRGSFPHNRNNACRGVVYYRRSKNVRQAARLFTHEYEGMLLTGTPLVVHFQRNKYDAAIFCSQSFSRRPAVAPVGKSESCQPGTDRRWHGAKHWA